jgi:hypothetical protein
MQKRSEYLLLFHGNYRYANVPPCYVYTYIAYIVFNQLVIRPSPIVLFYSVATC